MPSTGEILIERQDIDGLDITRVTEPGSERLRLWVAFPFDTDRIQAGLLPYGTSHLAEHVICCGGVDTSSAEETTEMRAHHGGGSNATTYSSIPGLLSFETLQPDDGLSIALEVARTAFRPAMRPSDVETQRAIVRREMQEKLHDIIRQRYALMGYRRGQLYKTDSLELARLDDITPQHLLDFHEQAAVRQNARLILAGSPETVGTLVAAIADQIAPELPEGKRIYANNGDIVPADDYHAVAPEIPVGMTDYSHCRVSRNVFDEGVAQAEMAVIAGAFREFLSEGRDGIVEQGRNQGLSYGLHPGWGWNRRQISLSISDKTSVETVHRHIQLLESSLARVALYAEDDFEVFRRKALGRLKIYPDDLFGLARSIEGVTASSDTFQAITPQEYRSTLSTLNPVMAVGIVRRMAERLSQPDFTVQSSFGENPFAR